MGAVYEVEHAVTGERLALKVLKVTANATDPTFIERFRREARVHALLKNEHLVRVIDAAAAPELGGAPYLVMDLLDGENLADLTDGEPQPPSRVIGWLHEIAAPLDAAHTAGIIHRDLKPENLFLARRADGSAIVKILDFGIAKVRDSGDVSHTGTGAVIGTPLYMAPEQAAAEHARIGPGTDMWSVGMIAFRLLTGRPYWPMTNVSLLLAELVGKPLKPPSSRVPRLTPAFDAWFMRSCHRDPQKRFDSVTQQVAALADALGAELPAPPSTPADRTSLTLPDLSEAGRSRRGVSVQSISGSVASTPRPDPGRSRSLPIIVALGVAAAASLVFWVSRERETPAAVNVPAMGTAARPLVTTTPSPAATAETAKPAPGPVPSASGPKPAVAPSVAAPTKLLRVRPPAEATAAPAPSAPDPKPDPLAEPK
jgi:serine/threonine-protein kinase